MRYNETKKLVSSRVLLLTSCTLALFALQACNTSSVLKPKVTSHGYQLNEETLALVPVGSSREQVLLSLGTPSTTLRDGGNSETLYYISQKRARPVKFMQPKVIDQRVLAIYFDDADNVNRIGNFGLKDGKVFDFVRRVTPTGGRELTFLSQLLGAAGTVVNPLGGGSSQPGQRS